MGLDGGQENTVEKWHGMRMNSAVLGGAVPLLFGQNRVSTKLIWYGDFVTKAAKEAGGKGLGKGGSNYVYSASIIALLAQGPINGLLNLWDSTGRFVQLSTSENYTVSGGSPSYTVANAAIYGYDQGAARIDSYSVTANDYGSPGSVTLAGTQPTPMTQVGSSPAAGQYTVNPSTGVYGFSTADNGKQIVISYSYYRYQIVTQETTIVPFSGPYTITVDNSTEYESDQGVVYFPSGTALTLVSSSPGVGQYSHSGATYTFNAGDSGQPIVISYVYKDPNTDTNAPTQLNLTLVSGAFAQAALSYMTSKHPSEALGYSQLGYIFSSGLYLGYTPELPNYSYEVAGAFQLGGGILDANPADCIYSLLTDPGFGVGFPSALVDTALLTVARQCWQANSFFISPLIEHQEACASIIGEWLEAGMVGAFFSEGLLKFVPYGDTTAVGNGVTFSPPTTPVANFTDNVVITIGAKDPVSGTRSPYADAWNKVQVEYSSRVNDYNPEVVSEEQEASIQEFGLRLEDPVSWDFITTLAAAQYAASMRVQRSALIRNKYIIKAPYTYSAYEPMDVVTLNDPILGLVATPVRLTKVTDDPMEGLEFEAEDFIWGAAAPAYNPKSTNTPYIPDTGQQDPGNTNALIIEVPNRFALQQGNMLYGFVNGSNPNWGGCYVYISYDGTDYQPYGPNNGKISAPARIGQLVANLATFSGTNPDTADTLAVKLNVSGAQLPSASSAQAAQLVSLCAVVSGTTAEFLSYEGSSLQGAELYDLTTLYRGVLGSSPAAHSIGDIFVRIDQNSFSGVYDPSYIGKTVYFKFLSFNLLGNQLQSLADVTAYAVTPTGIGKGAVDLNTGSILSITGSAVVSYAGSFSYSSTTSSIDWSWTGMQINRADGSVTSIPNGSQTITGLTANTAYYFYPYYDEVAQILTWVSISGGSGSPAIAYTTKTNQQAQYQNLSNEAALSIGAMTASTTSSGSGGGTGGGSGKCLLGSMKVETRAGVVAIDRVKVRDELRSPDGNGWTRVVRRSELPQETFIRITTARYGAVVCSPSHVFHAIDDEFHAGDVAAKDLTMSHCLFGRDRELTPLKSIEVVRLANSKKISLTCEPSHLFFAGEDAPLVQVHNAPNPS